MRVFAYGAQSFVKSLARAAGVKPLTCPPLSVKSFSPEIMLGHDLLFFDLHGNPGSPSWYGDGIPAMNAKQILSVDLSGATVFAMNCYLAEKDSPMMDALLDSGVRYVVGGDGENYAGISRVYGAAELGQWFRRWLAIKFGPKKALALAKQAIKLDLRRQERKGNPGRVMAAKDTLEFKMYYRERLAKKERYE